MFSITGQDEYKVGLDYETTKVYCDSNENKMNTQ